MVLEDQKMISAMDTALTAGSKSEYLPIRLKNNGDPDQHTYAIDQRGFEYLMTQTRDQMVGLGKSMLDGIIEIKPVKFGIDTACKYCEYRNLCKFETKLYDNQYREIEVMSNKDAKDHILLAKEEGSHESN